MLLRVFLKESFDMIMAYCKASNQFNLLKCQDWYDFARVLRNSLSHNFLVEYKNESDKKRLPISWNGISFTADMEGKPIQTSFLGIDSSLELHKAMRLFVENSL